MTQIMQCALLLLLCSKAQHITAAAGAKAPLALPRNAVRTKLLADFLVANVKACPTSTTPPPPSYFPPSSRCFPFVQQPTPSKPLHSEPPPHTNQLSTAPSTPHQPTWSSSATSTAPGPALRPRSTTPAASPAWTRAMRVSHPSIDDQLDRHQN